jgi:hypothetical protein
VSASKSELSNDEWLDALSEALRKKLTPGIFDKLIGDEWKKMTIKANPPHWCHAYKVKSIHYKEDK